MRPDELAILHESNDRFASLRGADDLRDLIEENLVFHDAILEAAGSERLARWSAR